WRRHPMIPPSSPQSPTLFLSISSLHANVDAVLTSPLGVNSRIIYFSRIASSRRNSIRRCTGKSGKVEQRGGQR
ncbi:hypothetical protein Drorol1_Dr00002706, partial [Drosera rotundifolia]